MLKIIINGASGKMGQAAVRALDAADDMQLLAGLGREDDLANSIATLAPDVVVDLTSAEVAMQNAKIILNAGVCPVIGTTGFSEQDIVELKQLAAQKNIGGIIAPNFSIGAILMMQFAKQANDFFQEVEIIEYHHHQKKDAPSGTAKNTQQLLKQNCPIHSVRLPGLVAHQSVIFGAPGETLTIKHDCIDRSAFMPGLLLCCREVAKQTELLYGMESLLGF